MNRHTQFYIDGRWTESLSDNRLTVTNPATEASTAAIALGCPEDAEAAIAAARAAFGNYSARSRAERIELLHSIAAVYKKRMDEVADAICTEMGAPLKRLAKPAHAGAMLAHLQVVADVLQNYAFHEDQGSTRIQREAIGVCGLITPWNWPIHQIGCKVVPALAAGCTMVLKPSELAPLSALVFADILHEAGVPAGVFNLVNGDGPTIGSILASHPEIDFVSFTGSTRAGIEVSIAAAPTVKKVALELGGKSANIILADADLELAVGGGVRGMLSNSGQNCNAPSRMLVPRDRMAEAEQIAKTTAAKAVIGDPRNDSTSMGPLANLPQFEKVQGLIQTGIDCGAKLICGGTGKPAPDSPGYFVRPTVFSEVDNDMEIAREEIFGPVLCMIPYDNEAQAVAIANDTRYGLAGYVSGANLETVRSVAGQLRVGNAHINGAQGDFSATFGGYKQSGIGREWGRHGFEEYLEVKSILGFSQADRT